MTYKVRRLLNYLPVSLSTRSDRRLRTANVRHVQFASLVEHSGCGERHVDRYERSLRRRRLVKGAFAAALAFALAWVVIESARAITLL